MSERLLTRPEAGVHGNLLSPGVRRDVTDLNRLYLERALDPHLATDPWFCVPAPAAERLRTAAPEARERAIQCPYTLFELCLPPPADALAVEGVADGSATTAVPGGDSRRTFGFAALAVFRRLAENLPLAARVAFGLPAEAEARLGALSLSESYRLAAWPGLVRPRWTAHERFWLLLAQVATGGEGAPWAYATGLCLLGSCQREIPIHALANHRRAARPRHPPRAARGSQVP